MCGGVASALAGPGRAEFLEDLKWLADKVTWDKVQTLMCGGVASALAGPGRVVFKQRIERLAKRVDWDSVHAALCNSVAKCLNGKDADAYEQRLHEWYALKGKGEHLGNGTVSRLMNDEFYAFMKTWWEFGGTKWFNQKASRMWPLNGIDTPKCKSYRERAVSSMKTYRDQHGAKARLMRLQ
jgi:hypothetical protein